MGCAFAEIFSRLRHERNMSQRIAAQELGISQALLSHYENGVREPRLDFVLRACDYYGVSADYMLGRTDLKADRRREESLREIADQLRSLADKAEENI